MTPVRMVVTGGKEGDGDAGMKGNQSRRRWRSERSAPAPWAEGGPTRLHPPERAVPTRLPQNVSHGDAGETDHSGPSTPTGPPGPSSAPPRDTKPPTGDCIIGRNVSA